MFDVVVVGGFAITRDESSIANAKRIAKEASKGGCLVQVISLDTGYAVAEYKNGKPTSNQTHFRLLKL
jgi:hypothetical protein